MFTLICVACVAIRTPADTLGGGGAGRRRNIHGFPATGEGATSYSRGRRWGTSYDGYRACAYAVLWLTARYASRHMFIRSSHRVYHRTGHQHGWRQRVETHETKGQDGSVRETTCRHGQRRGHKHRQRHKTGETRAQKGKTRQGRQERQVKSGQDF